MFGLDQISWKSFIQLIVFILLAWYAWILILAWINGKKNQRTTYFENHQEDDFNPGNFQPINVSAKEFPSELITPIPIPNIPFEVSFFEETGLDEGYAIDHFLEDSNSMLPTLLDQIQFQQ